MRILLATDGSANADAALEVVLHRPWQANTEIRVIAVLEPVHEMLGPLTKMLEFGKLASAAHENHKKLMESLVERYKNRLKEKFASDKISGELLEGRAKEKIVEEAASWGADTVVLGAHGKNEGGEFLFGSVPDFVLARAKSSVEILRATSLSTVLTEIEREQPVEEDKYLLALDDSDCSRCTLEEVLKRQWPERPFFKVMTVLEPLPFQAYSGLGPWEGAGSEEYAKLVSQTIEAQRQGAEKLVAEAAEKLSKTFAGSQVSTLVIEGYAKEQITKAAKGWPADLIIMGSHGRSGFMDFVLGSVSKATASNAPCSVLVIRSKAGSKAERTGSGAGAGVHQ